MHEKTLVTLSVNITRIRLTSLLSDVPRRRTNTLHANTKHMYWVLSGVYQLTVTPDL